MIIEIQDMTYYDLLMFFMTILRDISTRYNLLYFTYSQELLTGQVYI